MKSKQVFQNKKGLSLLELLLWLAICSILSLSYMSLAKYSKNIIEKSNKEDDIMMHGKFAIEYIKNEIASADYIIPTSKIKGIENRYGNVLDFILINKKDPNNKGSSQEMEYNYITYIQEGSKLYRIACNSNSENLPVAENFQGKNPLCDYIISIDKTKLDKDNKIVKIHLIMGTDNVKDLHFKTIIYLNSDVKI